MANMEECQYCDSKNANIFDCIKIRGGITQECVRITWRHE